MCGSPLLLSRTCAREIRPSTPQIPLRRPSLPRDTSGLTLRTLLPAVSIFSYYLLFIPAELEFLQFLFQTVSQPATPSLLSIASSATSNSFDTPHNTGPDRSTTPNSVYSQSPGSSLRPVSESCLSPEFQALASPQDDYLRRLPFVNTALKSYDYAKNNSRVVKFGAEMVESSVKTISKPVINRLPGAVTNRVSRRSLFLFSSLLLSAFLLRSQPRAFAISSLHQLRPFPCEDMRTCDTLSILLPLDAVCASGRSFHFFTSKATGRHALSLSPHQLFVLSPTTNTSSLLCATSAATSDATSGSRHNHPNSHIWNITHKLLAPPLHLLALSRTSPSILT